MTASDFDRRGFFKRGALLGGAMALDAQDAAAADQSGCPLPYSPPVLGAEVGVRYVERFSGSLGGVDDWELELYVEVERLADFVRGPHRAKIVGGFLSARERLPRTPILGGTAELFRDCADASAKESVLTFEYAEPSGRRVRGKGLRKLSRDGRDPGAQLAELTLMLEADGTPIASGALRSDVGDLLARLLSVQVVRAEGAAAEAARNTFLEFFNRACGTVEPGLPAMLAPKGRLDPRERRALVLLATVMLPERLPKNGPTITQAIETLETFVANADVEAFTALRKQLQFVGSLAPVKDGVIRAIRKLALDVLTSEKPNIARPILDSIHKVAVLGYYSHPAADALVGYKRPKFAPLYRTRLPVKEQPTARSFDVVIVGAGVAGSLLADRLTAAGKSVLLLEAGPYVAEAELTTDEALWIARLQKQSGLQRANVTEPYASRVGSVVLLQGACVGGGGMINNAVNFMLPKPRLEQWLGLGFPIAPRDLRRSYLRVAEELQIGPASEKTRFLNPVACLLENAFGKPARPVLGLPPSHGLFECMVNLATDRCLGCGMCNTGCGSERKRNALQVHLPRALAPGRDAELVPNARVVDILVAKSAGGSERVEALVVRTAKGDVRVRGREYVLSAGAISTSALMLRSQSLRHAVRNLPIGKRFSANVVSPMLSFYDGVLHHRPSLQLTHYYGPPGERDGFLIENLFNPPGQSALVMPGYGDVHFERMQKYASTALTGIAIGTSANGEVRLDADGNTVTTLPMGENEHRRMRAGFTLLARALLDGGGGVRPTELIAGVLGGGFSIKNQADIDRFDRWFESISRVVLSTGHPQGGSAMSQDARIGVVDSAFRVRGVSNLRICDASLFPMVSGVNPQWTVLAIADHCGNVMNRER